MKPVKVLSLFDGISCGRVALERANIPVERYVAYEIEKTAIKIAQKNYLDTEEMGDVFKADFHDYKGFDMLIGGSPCTYWSIAQKNRETVNSGIGWDLFSQYLRALKESETPYFLYENNASMSDAIRIEITKAFNEVMQWRKENFPKDSEAYKAACNYDMIEPKLINSALLSAQTRKRLYWTNIPCNGQDFTPENKGIKLSDIIEFGWTPREKAHCLTRRYSGFQGTESYQCRRYFNKSFGTAIFKDEESYYSVKADFEKDNYFDKGKEVEHDIHKRRIRQMTPIECERLQTLPDNYTEGVSDSCRINGCGNGWTVDVIAWLLSGFQRQKEPKKFKFGSL